MADLDPSEYTIDELDDEIGGIDDPETLREIREAETDGEDRTGAKDAIDDRIESVSDDQQEASDEGDEAAGGGGGGDEAAGGGGGGSDATSADIVTVRNRVRDATADLIGRPLDSIIEIERTDGEWRALVEIVERSSVPDTQDILGRYALELDGSGAITGYRRLDRYRRGDTRRDEESTQPL